VRFDVNLVEAVERLVKSNERLVELTERLKTRNGGDWAGWAPW
jgi:hypothetical protein